MCVSTPKVMTLERGFYATNEKTNYKRMKNIFFYVSGFACVLILFASTKAEAQKSVTIRGCVIDQNKHPIPFSSVYITMPQNQSSIVKGVISNDKGAFALPADGNKFYLLKVTFLGYKERVVKIRTDSVELNLGDIVLEQTSYKMSEVVVKPPLQVTADKIIYNFENDSNRSKSNLHEMISKMPMITVGSRGKIIVGSEGKTYIVLRKGREDALLNFENVSFEEMLKKLPAMGFTSFEIWTVVPPKYERYDYVVNIIPDPTQRLFGVVGSPEANYSFEGGALNSGIGGNGSADIFRVAGGVKYEYIDFSGSSRKTNTVFYAQENEPESLFNQEETSRNNSNVWRTNLMASLDISKQQFITFKFNASFRDAENYRQIASEKVAGEDTLSRSMSDYRIKNESNAWSVGAAYQLDFKKPARSLNISYLADIAPSQQYDNREINYTQGASSDEKTWSKYDIKSESHRFQLDYFDLFLKDKLSFSAQAGYLVMDYRSERIALDELTGIEDINRYTRFEQDFHRIDGFVNFSYNASKRLNISVKSNIDYLPNYNKTTSVTGTFEENIKQKELLFNPEAKFFYQFSIREPKNKVEKSFDEMTHDEKIAYITRQVGAGVSGSDIFENSSAVVPNSTLRLDYRYQQKRPGVSQLTNYSDEQDPLYIRRGNPFLHPESYHSLMLRFGSWFVNSLTASFLLSNDKIVSQSKREGNKVVQSFYNAGKVRDFSMELSHPFLKKKVTFSSNFSNFYTDFGDGNQRTQQRLKVGAHYHLKIARSCSSDFKLDYYKTFSSGTEGEEDLLPVDLSFSVYWILKMYGKEFSIMAGVNDILRWDRRTERYYDMSDYYQRVKTERSGLPLFLSISTTLGKFKVKPVKSAKSGATVRGFSTDVE